jgi:CxxC-x17-CxxC domain-containing protein
VPFTDKTLTCANCGQEFLFSADEQEFYAERGFSEPKRCRSCRAARRNEREGGDPNATFNRPARPEREMFDVTCSNCGRATQVPFQPRGDRPVYCRECFEKMGGGRPSGGSDFRSTQQPRSRF